jgi:hypothetical protein
VQITLSQQGVAYVWTRAASTWTLQATLAPDLPSAGENFGMPVALSGDGLTAAIGGLSTATVYIFVYAGAAWSQATSFSVNYLWSLAFASSGSYLFVGDAADNKVFVSGRYCLLPASLRETTVLQVYTGSGATWQQQAVLQGADAVSGDNVVRIPVLKC